MHELANALQMPACVFPFDTVYILPCVPLEIGFKCLCILGLVAFAQHAMCSLQNFHHQLQSAHFADVTGYLSAIHALLSRLQIESRYLPVGHLCKGLNQQLDPMLLHVSAQPLAKVVQRAYVKVPFPQVVVT